MVVEISLDLLPVLSFIANPFTVSADGDDGLELGKLGDVFDDEKDSIPARFRKGAGCNQQFQLRLFFSGDGDKLHWTLSNGNRIETALDGVANDAIPAFRSSSATFWNAEGVQTVEDLATASTVNCGFRESKYFLGGGIGVEYTDIFIDDEHWHRDRIEKLGVLQSATGAHLQNPTFPRQTLAIGVGNSGLWLRMDEAKLAEKALVGP